MSVVKPCCYGLMAYQPHDTYSGRPFDLCGEFAEAEVELSRQVVEPGTRFRTSGPASAPILIPLAQLVDPRGQVLLTRCRLLKIAVEGMEKKVLVGAAGSGTTTDATEAPIRDRRLARTPGIVAIRCSGVHSLMKNPLLELSTVSRKPLRIQKRCFFDRSRFRRDGCVRRCSKP